jgi:hypothetical protein
MESERALRCIRTEMTNIVTNIGVYYELPCDCTIQNYNNGYIEKKYGNIFCETFISYLARKCSKTVGFVASHGDVEVDEEGFMTMMFEAGKTYPPDDVLGHEWVSEGAMHGMDTRGAIQKLNEKRLKLLLKHLLKSKEELNMDNNGMITLFTGNETLLHGTIIMNKDADCLSN